MSRTWLKIIFFLWLSCSICYHFLNIHIYYGHPYSANLAIFSKYLRFLEVTMFQCFTGTITTALILKLLQKRTLVFPSCNKKLLAIIVVGHLFGTLSINAAVSMHSLYIQDFFRSFEPVMVYILLLNHGHHNGRNSFYVFFGVILMAMGFQAFMRHQKLVFTPWGITAAILPVFMYPLRNVSLKAFGETWQDPFEKYMVVSGCSFVILLFAVLVKLAYTRILPLFGLEMALKSIAFHIVDSLISMSILELFSPIFHSVLVVVIKYMTIIFLALTYSSFSISQWLPTIGMLLFPTGLMIFFKKHNLSNTLEIKRFIISSVLAFYLIFGGNILWKLHFNAKSTTIKQTPRTIRSFWVYNQPLNEDILFNMQSLLERSTNKLQVLCGTFSCMKKVDSLKDSRISPTFLTFDAIARNSPLEEWFKAHVVHKTLSGKYFETHLHEATKLALLWRYGGTIVDPFLRIHEKQSRKLDRIREACIAKIPNHNSSEILYAFKFKKRHPFVKMLLSIFAKLHHRLCYLGQYCNTLNYNFNVQSWIALENFCKNDNRCPKTVKILAQKTDYKIPSEKLDTTAQFNQTNSKSLSTGIQNFASIQFFPSDGTAPGSSRNNGKLLQHRSGLLPQFKTRFHSPTSLAEMLALGKYLSLKYIESSFKIAPVGCLDMRTVDFLRSNKVDAYLSAGIGLLTKPPVMREVSRNKIYIVSLNETLLDQFPREIQEYGIRLSLGKKSELNLRRWIKSLHVFLRKIARAKLVITGDFHCASVALAFDTPVFYVQTQNASKRGQDSSSVFHTWNTKDRSLNASDAVLISKLLSGEIPAAADLSLFMRLRATTWSAMRENEVVRESGLKFGIVPFPRPRSNTVENNTFHLIFTTSERSLIVLEDDTGGNKVTGIFAWRHWRCVEAIFYHHPMATVIIHSNTLSSSVFDVLSESGYRIQVKPYNLTALAEGTPAEVFVQDELRYAKEGKHWYSHETDLLRLLILYKYGGIYMDIDVIIVRDSHDLPLNTIGWESGSNLNGAFLKFQSGHPYLHACIARFSQRYSQAWSDNGPLLLSRVWREWSSANPDNDVTTASPIALYMFFYRSIRQSCFEDTSGVDFDENWKILRSQAYAVHLYSKVTADYGGENNKIKEGTLCKYILNAFCVLCIKVY